MTRCVETLKPLPDVVVIGARTVAEELTQLKFVGPKSAPLLEAAEITAESIRERRVSHAQLKKAGVNPGVAARIRREHSLPWSLEGGEDLDRRAEQVRGLKAGEREWIAASASKHSVGTDGDTASPDRSEDTGWEQKPWPNHDPAVESERGETEWRERSRPTPLSAVPDIDDRAVTLLGEAGITSVNRLQTCDTEAVARSLELDETLIEEWREAARKYDEVS